MVCANCGYSVGRHERFCRHCGNLVAGADLSTVNSNQYLTTAPFKDADELTGNGIGKVIVGDGFLMVAVFLSVTSSAISSLLWLLMLIPSFFFFGKGFADVLHARQIRRRTKQVGPTGSISDFEKLHRSISGELALPSVTDPTTRNLK